MVMVIMVFICFNGIELWGIECFETCNILKKLFSKGKTEGKL